MLTLPTHRRRLRALLAPLFELAADHHPRLIGELAGVFVENNPKFPVARFTYRGSAGEGDLVRLGFFALIHGDEPAGASALYQLIGKLCDHPELAEGYEIVCYPVCNPTGFEAGTRECSAGLDLNREFWRGSARPEVQILERELRLSRFDGLISLHADDSSEGLYGFARGATLAELLLDPALRQAEGELRRNAAQTIDGFEAKDGIISHCYEGILTAPAETSPRPFEIIFETPGRAPVSEQAHAATRACQAIISSYREILARAADI
jgi:murein peptide amidase A